MHHCPSLLGLLFDSAVCKTQHWRVLAALHRHYDAAPKFPLRWAHLTAESHSYRRRSLVIATGSSMDSLVAELKRLSPTTQAVVALVVGSTAWIVLQLVWGFVRFITSLIGLLPKRQADAKTTIDDGLRCAIACCI
jgi:hypothetical protein